MTTHDPADVVELPAEEVLTRLIPSQGASWDEELAEFDADPILRELVDALEAEYRRDGRFERPLWVALDEEGEGLYLADGRARLVAARRVGGTVALSSIPPVLSDDLLEVVVELPDLMVPADPAPGDDAPADVDTPAGHDDATGHDDGDDDDDPFNAELATEAFWRVRSLRIPGGPWVTAANAGFDDEVMAVVFECEERWAEPLAAEVQRRLAGAMQVGEVEVASVDPDDVECGCGEDHAHDHAHAHDHGHDHDHDGHDHPH